MVQLKKFHVKEMTNSTLSLSTRASICLGQRLQVCVRVLYMSLSEFKNIFKAKEDCWFLPLNYSFHLAHEPTCKYVFHTIWLLFLLLSKITGRRLGSKPLGVQWVCGHYVRAFKFPKAILFKGVFQKEHLQRNISKHLNENLFDFWMFDCGEFKT